MRRAQMNQELREDLGVSAFADAKARRRVDLVRSPSVGLHPCPQRPARLDAGVRWRDRSEVQRALVERVNVAAASTRRIVEAGVAERTDDDDVGEHSAENSDLEQ